MGSISILKYFVNVEFRDPEVIISLSANPSAIILFTVSSMSGVSAANVAAAAAIGFELEEIEGPDDCAAPGSGGGGGGGGFAAVGGAGGGGFTGVIAGVARAEGASDGAYEGAEGLGIDIEGIDIVGIDIVGIGIY